jgi:hypothetical protein
MDRRQQIEKAEREAGMSPKILGRRRAAPLMAATGLVVLALAGVVFDIRARVTPHAAAGAQREEAIVWDVAIDCRTWRFGRGNISFAEFGRGDSFIADGAIFPAGTIPSGEQQNDPGAPGSIGTWTQRGTMATTQAEILAGARPAFFATWVHRLRDGSGLVADGPHPESGPMAVVGGMGQFSGAGGELSEEIIGTNSTGCPNLRLTIKLRQRAP